MNDASLLHPGETEALGKKAELVKSIVKSPDFWVRADAIGTGVAVTAEGVLLGLYLHALPVLLGVAAAGASAALVGCGLYSLYVGTTGTASFIKKTYQHVFNKAAAPAAPKPPRPTLLQRLARSKPFKPLVAKLSQKPLVKKFLDSPIGKLRGGLTQPQRDLFMVSLNLKGSLFVGGTAAVYLAMRMMALPAVHLAGLVTAATAVASYYVVKSLFDIVCGAKVLFRHFRERRAAKKAAKQKARTGAKPDAKPGASPVPAPAQEPAPAAKAPASGPQQAFAKSGAPEESKPAPPAPPSAPPPKPPAAPP
jgi:hypothetical protein